MIFHRLAWLRIKEYFKEEEPPILLLRKKKKKIYKPELNVDQELNLYVSIIMTVVSVLVWFSIPLNILDSPCELFIQRKMDTLHTLSNLFYRHVTFMDIFIIALFILLIVVSVDTIYDAIENTDISKSPWVVRGKYVPIKKHEKTPEELWLLYVNEIKYIYEERKLR